MTLQQVANLRGSKGDTGDAGPGIPAGGTTGQVLAKATAADLDTTWATPLALGSTAGTAADAGAVATADALAAQKTSNLSDLVNAATARTNLGLGTAATHPATDFDSAGAAAAVTLASLDAAASAEPLAVKLAGDLSGTVASPVVSKINGTAVGDAATKSVGTTSGTVAEGDDSRIVISTLTAASAAALANELPINEAGSPKKVTLTQIAALLKPVPAQYLLFHGGTTGVYTLTPLTAGTVEPANVPMSRILPDLSKATQMRLVIGQRIMGAGGTTCAARLQYATNGATQTAWADANATGTGLSLQGGTANTVRDGGWVNLATGAKIDSCYMRLAIVTTGTVTTAPTLSFAEVEFR